MSAPNTIQTKNRADLSQFLIHLTKNGTFEELRHHPVVARNSLESMVINLKIDARSAFGYFKLKINMYRAKQGRVYRNEDADPDWIKCVCFSETPLGELANFYQTVLVKRNKYQKYGLAFWQENVRKAGGNPIFYFDSNRKDFQKAFDSTYTMNRVDLIPIMHLIESFGPLILPNAKGHSDFRWEREWRKKGDYKFNSEDVAFGICPDSEISYFKKLGKNQIVFIDPDWDKSTLSKYLQIEAPHLLVHL